MSGCFTSCTPKPEPQPQVATKSETEIAVEQIKGEWLEKCEGATGEMPKNSVGDLLLDYNAQAVLLSVCLKRHNSLVDYLLPFVEKEKARELTK